MERTTGLIAGFMLLALLMLAGCGVAGDPVTPQPNTLPDPGSVIDRSDQVGSGDGAVYGSTFDTDI